MWVISVHLRQTCSSASLSVPASSAVCFPAALAMCFKCTFIALNLPNPLSLCLLSVSFRLPLCVDMPGVWLHDWFVPINSHNNDSCCLFDWIASECGSSEFSQAVSANLAVLSQSQTLAVHFPSAPTNRVKKEWIPSPAKHHYLIEGGSTVIDMKQRAGNKVSLLDFSNAQSLVIPSFEILGAKSWAAFYFWCTRFCTGHQITDLISNSEWTLSFSF